MREACNTHWVLGVVLSLAACDNSGLARANAVASVKGAICNEATRTLVPEANVTLLEKSPDGALLSQHDTIADLEGRFTIERVYNGTHTVRAEKGAFRTEFEVTITGSRDVELPEPGCQLPIGNVVGRVCDAQRGEWVEGASVYAVGPSGVINATGISAADGSFSINGVPTGHRDIVADKNGKKYAVQALVRAGETVDAGPADCVINGLSNIEGQICANSVGIWLSGAKVTTTAGSSTFTTTTGIDGKFTLRGLPPGTYDVTAQKGAYQVGFRATTEANRTTVKEAVCTPPDIPIAVVSGDFDSVQKAMRRLKFANVTVFKGYDGHNTLKDLAADREGSWSAQLLDGAMPQIFNYKIAMFNSGVNLDDLGPYASEQYERRINVLRQFVTQGGFVFISDWAYQLIAGSFGAPVGFFDGGAPGKAQVGIEGTYNATVTDPALAATLGAQSLPLNMRTPQWAVVTTATDDVKVYLTATAQASTATGFQQLPGTPLLLSFGNAEGRVVYSAFQTSDQHSTEIDRIIDFLIFEL